MATAQLGALAGSRRQAAGGACETGRPRPALLTGCQSGRKRLGKDPRRSAPRSRPQAEAFSVPLHQT